MSYRRIFLIVLAQLAVCMFARGQSTVPPSQTQGPILRNEGDPRPGDSLKPPTAAEIRDWHCEAPLLDLATPAQAYKTMYFAVKCKNVVGIKNVLSRETIEFMTAAAEMQKKPFDEAIANGLSESTFSNTLPKLCADRVKKKMGALEVKRTDGVWEDLPFVWEDGQWKLAVGDLFKGTYRKPGPTKCMTPPVKPKVTVGPFTPAAGT